MNHLGLIFFGKRRGLEVFDAFGVGQKILNSKDMPNVLLQYLQLDLEKGFLLTHPREKLSCISRFYFGGHIFLVFARYNFARDQWGRLGYFAAALILKDYYVPPEFLIPFVEKIHRFSSSVIDAQTYRIVEVPFPKFHALPFNGVPTYKIPPFNLVPGKIALMSVDSNISQENVFPQIYSASLGNLEGIERVFWSNSRPLNQRIINENAQILSFPSISQNLEFPELSPTHIQKNTRPIIVPQQLPRKFPPLERQQIAPSINSNSGSSAQSLSPTSFPTSEKATPDWQKEKYLGKKFRILGVIFLIVMVLIAIWDINSRRISSGKTHGGTPATSQQETYSSFAKELNDYLAQGVYERDTHQALRDTLLQLGKKNHLILLEGTSPPLDYLPQLTRLEVKYSQERRHLNEMIRYFQNEYIPHSPSSFYYSYGAINAVFVQLEELEKRKSVLPKDEREGLLKEAYDMANSILWQKIDRDFTNLPIQLSSWQYKLHDASLSVGFTHAKMRQKSLDLAKILQEQHPNMSYYFLDISLKRINPVYISDGTVIQNDQELAYIYLED